MSTLIQFSGPGQIFRPGIMLVGFVLLASAVAGATRTPPPLPKPHTYEELLDHSDAIVVGEIAAVDASATAFDGPAWVTMRVRKNLDGTLPDGELLVFSQQSSFRGARCRVGELRILFLGRTSARGPYPMRSEWYLKLVSKQRGRPPVQTGFFVDEPQIPGVDLKSLRAFLRGLDEAGGEPERVQFSLPGK